MGTWGFLPSYNRYVLKTLLLSQRCQDSSLVSRDTSRFSSNHGRAEGTPLELRRETQGPFPVATGILAFLSIFTWSQAFSPVEACNSAFLLRCQRGVKTPVEKRRGTRALSRFSTGDSDIPSCCERKHQLAFESLQGNQALPQGRGARCPFHLTQHTQGNSLIPIAERSLLLRCIWKVGIPLESKPGNQFSSRNDLGYTELFLRCCSELSVPLNL